MKARVKLSKDVREAVIAEVKAEEQRIYEEAARQLTAAVLYTLQLSCDFGKKRIRRFFAELNSTYEDMSGVHGMVGGYEPTELIELCRERYGIDLDAEIHTEVKYK